MTLKSNSTIKGKRDVKSHFKLYSHTPSNGILISNYTVFSFFFFAYSSMLALETAGPCSTLIVHEKFVDK